MSTELKPTEIPDRPIPLINGNWTNSTGSNSDSVIGDNPTQGEILEINFPRGITATEVISESLDTQSKSIKGAFTFEQLGSINIGTSQNGVFISPTGVVAYKNGIPTVTISSTGDASFLGTIKVGTSIETGVITASYINALGITADSVNSNWVYAGNISANQINAGSLSADRIQGGTLSLGGNNNQFGVLRIKNSSGDTGVYGDNNGLILYDDRFSSIAWSSSGNQAHGAVGYSSNTYFLTSFSGKNTLISSDASLYLNANNDTYFNRNSIYINNQKLEVDDTSLTSYREAGTNYPTLKWGNGSTFKVANTGNGFQINGNVKNAVVPTSKGYRALYCTESPEVWFMDFCAGKKQFSTHKTWKFWKWGMDWVAHPDPMFLEVAVVPYVIMPTAVKGLVQIWGKRKGHENKRFEEKTQEEFEKNEKFLEMAKVLK